MNLDELEKMDKEYEEEKQKRELWGKANNLPMLFSTEQYRIDFELYNRGIIAEHDFDDFEDRNNIHFTYEGVEYSLYDLGLSSSEDPDGADFYWVELHSYAQENHYVDPKDFIWNLLAYQKGHKNYTRIKLPFDSEFPKQILEIARVQWPEIEEWAQSIFEKIIGAKLPDSTKII